jgi:hypothetical protein
MNTIYPDLTKQPCEYELYLLEVFTKASIDFPTETHDEYLKACQEGEWTASNQYFNDIDSILNEEIFNYDNHKENPIFFETLESKGYRDAEKVIELLYKYKQMIEQAWEIMYETR